MTPQEWKELLNNIGVGVSFVSVPAIILLWKHLQFIRQCHQTELDGERQYSRDRDNSTLVVLNSVLEYIKGEDKREGIRNQHFEKIMEAIESLKVHVTTHLEKLKSKAS